jgi:hypothetical protein
VTSLIRERCHQLTDTYTHVTSYTYEANGVTYPQTHLVECPSLLYQLQHPDPHGSSHTGRGKHSQPSALISPDSLDTYQLIKQEATTHWTNLRVALHHPRTHIRRWFTPEATIKLIALNTPHLTHGALAHTNTKVREWWAAAHCATGWAPPPKQPRTTCPNCYTPDTIRLRTSPLCAWCVNCHSSWDKTTINQLKHA